ncbi:hypothetical protein [Alkalihalobacillus sp. LMS39]|uniref:hypothetical protein n=1 Tax=Alkalihalobacillus sp. LMS39 TaxID=2924032 RepID=UPI001FB4FD7B|nr:hypothetical protein [Alkalihalobacillus sp. LMS39]UOE92038.1 hypothetical protein MM271_12235 [Alkalihalobacillus sp. LMS39]
MRREELFEKIKCVQTGQSDMESFVKPRPPEEFGDGVKLTYDKESQRFQATVFDPDTDTVFSKETFTNENEVGNFIMKTID